MKTTKPKAYGLAELCEMTGFAYNNRMRLRARLPKPDAELRMGPVWLSSTIERWLRTTDVVDQVAD